MRLRNSVYGSLTALLALLCVSSPVNRGTVQHTLEARSAVQQPMHFRQMCRILGSFAPFIRSRDFLSEQTLIFLPDIHEFEYQERQQTRLRRLVSILRAHDITPYIGLEGIFTGVRSNEELTSLKDARDRLFASENAKREAQLDLYPTIGEELISAGVSPQETLDILVSTRDSLKIPYFIDNESNTSNAGHFKAPGLAYTGCEGVYFGIDNREQYLLVCNTYEYAALGDGSLIEHVCYTMQLLREHQDSEHDGLAQTAQRIYSSELRRVKELLAAQKRLREHVPRQLAMELINIHDPAKLRSYVRELAVNERTKHWVDSVAAMQGFVIVIGGIGHTEAVELECRKKGMSFIILPALE